MKALSSAADSLKSSDSSNKIAEILEKVENGFQVRRSIKIRLYKTSHSTAFTPLALPSSLHWHKSYIT